MSRVRTSVAFLWDFVVGDDWVTAAGVVLALALTALVAQTGASAWVILPVAVVVLLSLYLWRAVRAQRRS